MSNACPLKLAWCQHFQRKLKHRSRGRHWRIQLKTLERWEISGQRLQIRAWKGKKLTMSCNRTTPVCNLKRESLPFSEQEIPEFIDDPVTKQMFRNKSFFGQRLFSTVFPPALSPIIQGPEQPRLAAAGSGTPLAYTHKHNHWGT